jgi:uncharacterized membrane protein YjgN (DUF898 family)
VCLVLREKRFSNLSLTSSHRLRSNLLAEGLLWINLVYLLAPEIGRLDLTLLDLGARDINRVLR